MRDTFAKFHPAVNMLYFCVAIILAMFLVHPVYLSISLFCSYAFFFTLNGKKKWRLALGLLIALIILAIINAFINSRGDTVLFLYCKNRPFTLEALYYGLSSSTIFVSVLLWFSCYNIVLSNDKITYLFSRMAPASSLVFSMVMRLIPHYQYKIKEIRKSRQGIGKVVPKLGKLAYIFGGISVISILTSWALEDAVITTDSMRSRGFGSGKRSSFLNYTFDGKNVIVCCVFIICIMLTLSALISGALKVNYYPTYQQRTLDLGGIVGAVSYFIFLFTPTFLHWREELIWRKSKLKI